PKGDKSKAPDPKAAKNKDTGKMFKQAADLLNALKSKEPFTRVGLDKELSKAKGTICGVDFDVKLNGGKWSVVPKAGSTIAKKGVQLGAVKDESGGKDDPDAMPDIEAKADLSMTGEGHTVTAIAHGGVLQIMMASALQKRLNDTLAGAIKEVNKPDSNIKATDRASVTAELQKLQADVKESK